MKVTLLAAMLITAAIIIYETMYPCIRYQPATSFNIITKTHSESTTCIERRK
jgi:hypothetical protein